jgi:hypothetical protein
MKRLMSIIAVLSVAAVSQVASAEESVANQIRITQISAKYEQSSTAHATKDQLPQDVHVSGN